MKGRLFFLTMQHFRVLGWYKCVKNANQFQKSVFFQCSINIDGELSGVGVQKPYKLSKQTLLYYNALAFQRALQVVHRIWCTRRWSMLADVSSTRKITPIGGTSNYFLILRCVIPGIRYLQGITVQFRKAKRMNVQFKYPQRMNVQFRVLKP